MFQDNYEIRSQLVEDTLRDTINSFLNKFDSISTERVVAECWIVDLLWSMMTEQSQTRNHAMRHLWYTGVSMGELSKRTGISKGRISKIIHGNNQ